jgi:F-type H+-transporting ATPase subunit delta
LIGGAVARRYAKALADVAAGSQALEPVQDDLRAFVRLLTEQRELRQFIANPAIARKEAVAAVTDIARALGLRPLAVRFLTLLVESGRLGALEPILRAYEEQVDGRLGRVRATVTWAAPLPEAEQAALRQRLAAVTGKTVYLDARTDPALLGGVVAQIGSQVYDGSLRTQLRRMREELTR